MTPSKRIREANRTNRERDTQEDANWRELSESVRTHGVLAHTERPLTGIERQAIEEEARK